VDECPQCRVFTLGLLCMCHCRVYTLGLVHVSLPSLHSASCGGGMETESAASLCRLYRRAYMHCYSLGLTPLQELERCMRHMLRHACTGSIVAMPFALAWHSGEGIEVGEMSGPPLIRLGLSHINACLLDGRWVLGRHMCVTIAPCPIASAHRIPTVVWSVATVHVAIGLDGVG
jgi:hypothetical protein